ncbi:cytochrome aa3 quinol oxidase subunit III [Listeria grayi]|uniref:Quinol oxidase subunit 3 n=2 Tax=Listeria grayi TaxID=1641 RepID=D7UV07_LISGR|nr:cytochrome aa3 quinol oxidase subunit III [Listeria grayi]EFI85083.1 cytochrome aa3 quinol oxidase, subunit III [Listeria grayi DSM 20601]MBC1921924.1 cytochrome aa3 quinol oxidase subunit III [Listeria grayi]STY44710.1 Quinol oxidase subunit 3 [Listeria grayi]
MESVKKNDDRPLEYQSEQGSLNIIGFWTFLTAEIALFATLFATYFVMEKAGSNAGHPPSEMFELWLVLVMTFLLLTSSFTCGLAIGEMRKGNVKMLVVYMIITLLLGAGFVGFEIYEFSHYVMEGVTMQVGSYWSSFFVLLGTHGLHVTIGLFWITFILIQLKRGLTPKNASKLFITSLYWHFLDVVWIFIFTGVYLYGMVN